MSNNGFHQFRLVELGLSGWVKATGLPDAPKTVANLIAKGWIESQKTEGSHIVSLSQDFTQ